MTDEELHVLLHELREKQAHERAKLVQEPPAEPAEPDPAPEPDTGFRITESADAAEENTRILQAADAGQDDTAETDAMPFADLPDLTSSVMPDLIGHLRFSRRASPSSE